MQKIAGYYRLARRDDDIREESKGITNQRLVIKEYISQDTELCQYEFCEFIDDGYSGTKMNRPGLQELIRHIKNGEFQVVIVKDFSRFTRDYYDLRLYLEQIFPSFGVRFISVNDHYDSRGLNGRSVKKDILKNLLEDLKGASDKVKSR